MYPLRRFVKTMASALRGDRIDALDTVTITLPVTHRDVEFTRMNNGRYLALMDLGRFALTMRGGYLRVIAKRRWYPLVTSVAIRYRRSLVVGTNFDLSTRIVCWTRREFFIEQWFVQDGDVRARALVRAVFMGPKGPVPCPEVMGAGGFRTESPPIPEFVRAWQAAEASAFAAPAGTNGGGSPAVAASV